MRTNRAASVSKAMSERPQEQRASLVPHGSDESGGMNEGMRVLSYLISGVAVYGALGWLGDHLLGTAFLLPIGIVAGAGLGIYVIIRRFGQVEEAGAPGAAGPDRRGPGSTDKTEGTT
jgi:F0F1-type ATP synthase assembly protein I